MSCTGELRELDPNLLRALRNTQATQYRAAMCRPATVPLLDSTDMTTPVMVAIPSARVSRSRRTPASR